MGALVQPDLVVVPASCVHPNISTAEPFPLVKFGNSLNSEDGDEKGVEVRPDPADLALLTYKCTQTAPSTAA